MPNIKLWCCEVRKFIQPTIPMICKNKIEQYGLLVTLLSQKAIICVISAVVVSHHCHHGAVLHWHPLINFQLILPSSPLSSNYEPYRFHWSCTQVNYLTDHCKLIIFTMILSHTGLHVCYHPYSMWVFFLCCWTFRVRRGICRFVQEVELQPLKIKSYIWLAKTITLSIWKVVAVINHR